MSERNPEIERLVESLQESQISRRQFVARATALGFSSVSALQKRVFVVLRVTAALRLL